jgi:hypothetical protein
MTDSQVKLLLEMSSQNIDRYVLCYLKVNAGFKN